jgi:uncharacterized protein (DUF427 family)
MRLLKAMSTSPRRALRASSSKRQRPIRIADGRAMLRAGQEFKDAAWYYPEPMEKAKHIKDFVAFCE